MPAGKPVGSAETSALVVAGELDVLTLSQAEGGEIPPGNVTAGPEDALTVKSTPSFL